jgi:type IV pilus assembly protein PilX
MQNATLEERMAGNLKDRNTAFQSAEAALRVAQDWIDGLRNPPMANDSGSEDIWSECTVGERAVDEEDNTAECAKYSAPEVDWFDTTGNYLDFTSRVLGEKAELSNVSAQPKLVVEQHYVPPLDFEKQAKGTGVHHYTVTSIGYGGTANAKSMLQTTVQKVYGW